MSSTNEISNNDLLAKVLLALENNKKEIIERTEAENAKLLNLLENQTKRTNELEEKYCQLEQKYLRLERDIRRNNVIIFGIEVTPQKSHLGEEVVNTLNQLLGINLSLGDVNNVFIIRNNKSSPVKLELKSYLQKQLIFSNIHKLKNTKVFTVNDLC
nr:unnamed protein product [Callosobruchus analis]